MTRDEYQRKVDNLSLLEQLDQGEIPIAKALRIAINRAVIRPDDGQ